MSTVYAERTKVPPMQSLMQIQAALKKAGATQFMLLSDDERGSEGVMFKRAGISYSLAVDVPEERMRARLLRALLLIVKAKIVAVDAGVRTFEEEFLNDVMLADGSTYGSVVVPQIKRALESGALLKALPMSGSRP